MALKLKSNNSQGNPYHDEEGKFTSKGGEGTGGSEKKSDPLMDLFGSLGKSMRDSEAEEKEAMKLFGLKGDEEKTDISDDYGLEAVRREIDNGKSFEEIKEFIQKLDPLDGEVEYDDDFVHNYIEEAKNATDKNNKLEEKQASKLFGMDLSNKKTWQVDVADPEMAQFLQLDYKGRNQAQKEGRLPKQFEKLDANTINSLMAGYNESVMDTPSTVSYTEHYGYDIGDYGTVDTGEEEKNIDVGIDDVVNYLKTQVTISPEDEELIRRNHVVPTRIMKEIFGDKASDEDLEEALADFLR